MPRRDTHAYISIIHINYIDICRRLLYKPLLAHSKMRSTAMQKVRDIADDVKGFGRILARARKERGYSQLALALRAEVSPKHLSFLETGRSRPSRAMLATLIETLAVSEDDKKDFYVAAGFAPRENPYFDDICSSTLSGMSLILRSAEPFPAVVLDRFWRIVMINRPYGAFIEALSRGRIVLKQAYMLLPEPRVNSIEAMIGSDYYLSRVLSWRETIASELSRVKREVAVDADSQRREWLSRIEIDARSRGLICGPEFQRRSDDITPFVPVKMRMGPMEANLVNVVMPLRGDGGDRLSGLRVKLYYPADNRAEQAVRDYAFTN
nr:helix-turn-helix domain-containing protein [Methylosinus sp. H3A]